MLRRLGIVLFVSLLAGGADARQKPLHRENWWRALDTPSLAPPAQGIVTVRAAAAGTRFIAGGRFLMGSTPDEMADAVVLCKHELLRGLCDRPEFTALFRAEGHLHSVRISPFFLDATEVTVADYARCVDLGECSPPGFTRGDARYDRPNLPVTAVTWIDAQAYCHWRGGRLPTEAEWEFAARGTSNRRYPWGNVYNSHLANHGALAHDETDGSDGFVGLAPVGSFPDGATPAGVLDMAGNAAEWVEDVYSLDDDGYGYGPEAVLDPRGDAATLFKRGRTSPNPNLHVVRGGSYLRGAPWMRAAMRGVPASTRAADIGFRCTEDPTDAIRGSCRLHISPIHTSSSSRAWGPIVS